MGQTTSNNFVEQQPNPQQRRRQIKFVRNEVENNCPSCDDAEVLFFPDTALPCFSFYDKLMGQPWKECRRTNCRFLHGPPNESLSSLMKLYNTLDKAERQIDICVYLFTQEHLVHFLSYLKKERKIKVRIITDSGGENEYKLKTQIKALQDANIEVKTNISCDGALMHHKFCIIDRKKLMFGSFNYTNSAVLKNEEAIVITGQKAVVDQFSKKFEILWGSSRAATRNSYEDFPTIQMDYQPPPSEGGFLTSLMKLISS